LSDTLKCLECYSDVIVLRHPQIGAARNVVQKDTLKKPLLNAGDGAGEHPTQALLDLFTIYDELKIPFSSPTPPPPQSIVDTSESASEHLNIVLLGDLKHGRTVHSLAKLLARCVASPKMKSITLRYCSPPSLQMPDQVKNYVKNYPNTIIREQEDYTDLKEAIKGANILYVTRVQKERFQNLEDYEAVKDYYVVNTEILQDAPSNMVIMHPLPRVNEIDEEVDKDPRAAYFRQMENGMYVRMALLALVLGKA